MIRLLRPTLALATALLLAACAGIDTGEFSLSGDDYSPFGYDEAFPGAFFGSPFGFGMYDGGFPESGWGWGGMGGYDTLPLPP